MHPPLRPVWSFCPFALRAEFARGAGATALGFDPVRLRRLDAVIQDHVGRKQIAGGVMFGARDGDFAT